MAETGKEAERRRLAEALRANLKRRKAAARPAVAERRTGDKAAHPAATAPDDGERG